MSERDIFMAVVQKKGAEARAVYLREACGADAALRQRVEDLLGAYERAGGFLESPAPVLAEGLNGQPLAERPGTVVGPYKLLEQIGEGGMGVVYLAEQTLPVRRRVALKVIKPGMDTKQVVARFEAERQALAMMDHPNIARVLDGGATPEGRPYFVMELVRGIPITDYCDREKLSIPERLELFVLVCRAVQHAHQKGIIHRDLKPSNMLVTLVDGTPVPKVIDFGVAKATGRSLTDKTLHTGLTQLVGTPLYMSPEQAELSGLDVDTRSDVYSLGVLLYELLTGTTPFGEERLRTAAFDEVRRIIREEEPPPPSTRLGALGDALTDISTRRGSDPRRLGKLVRGELDWIVMKALEKDRDRRYETANGLAADVRHYLSDEPVQACAPSASYRLHRFVRRNRAALVTSALVASALLLGTAAATYFALRATEEERLARQKAVEAQAYARRANQEAKRARDEKLLSDHRWYVAEMNLAQQAWREDRLDAAQEHLQALEPKRPENPDLRGFDWYYLRRLGQWQDLRTLRQSGIVTGVAFSPDGRTIATGSGDGLVRLWDAATGQEVRTLHGHEVGIINALAFSPDGHRLVSAGSDRTVRVWDVGTGQELRKLAGHTSAVLGVAYCDDGRTLASAGADRTVKLWDATTGREGHTLHGHAGVVWGVAFSPDGRTVASASRDQTMRLWDTATGQEIRTLRGHSNALRSVAFSPDSRTIASASWDQTVKLWDAATGREGRALRGHTGPLTGVAFSPDGESVATSAWDGTVRLWDIATGEVRRTLRGHACIQVNAVAFSPDGRTLASAGYDGTVRLWDALPGQEALTLRGHVGGVGHAVFSPDGRRIASPGQDCTVRLWDADTGQEVRSLRGHTASVRAVAFSPDGRLIASTGDDRTVRIWDAVTGREVRTLRGHTALTRGVAFSPDGRTLASGNDDKTVTLWDAKTGKELRTLSGHTHVVRGVAFSPDGRTLATASYDKSVKLWDADSGQLVRTLSGPEGPVEVVAFSLDGRTIATASEDKIVRLWDTATGQLTRTLSGHTDAVRGVAFSPDGRTIATAGNDQTVKLRDLVTGQEVLTLRGHTAAVNTVAFSPDGRQLASASGDKTIRVWDARPLTPRLRVLREAQAVVAYLFDKHLSVAQVLDRIHNDPSFSAEVRSRALELAGPYGQSLVTQEAERVVNELYNKAMLRPEVLEKLRTDASLGEPVRQQALALAEQIPESPIRLHSASWDMVRLPGAEPAAYRLALRQAEVTCRLMPNDGYYLTALGMAQYRVGQYREAAATLTQAAKLQADLPCGLDPANLAFLALSQHHLGRNDEAFATLNRLREALVDRGQARNPQDQAFLREAEALELDMAFPRDPFAQ